jgi:hypothetical protein
MDIKCSDTYRKFLFKLFEFFKIDLKCIFIIGAFAPMSQNTMYVQDWLYCYHVAKSRSERVHWGAVKLTVSVEQDPSGTKSGNPKRKV